MNDRDLNVEKSNTVLLFSISLFGFPLHWHFSPITPKTDQVRVEALEYVEIDRNYKQILITI